MNTGHDGSLTTLHAITPRDAISRLETMCLMAGMDLPVKSDPPADRIGCGLNHPNNPAYAMALAKSRPSPKYRGWKRHCGYDRNIQVRTNGVDAQEKRWRT
jgi:hypothetical protein